MTTRFLAFACSTRCTNVGATFRSPSSAATMQLTPRRKRIRLDRQVYTGRMAFSVTINTLDRHRAFLNEATVRLCLHSLREAREKLGMSVLAYCFMPDHLHLLLEGSDQSNLIDFMKRFKQLSGFGYKTETGRQLWQKGYYDHVVRQEEDLKGIALYIFENPCRAGWGDDPASYPHSGGAYFEPMLERRPEGRPYGNGGAT